MGSTAISGPEAPAAPPAPPLDEPAEQTDKVETAPDALETIAPTRDDELFDGKGFELKATIDGELADKIQIGFTGTDVRDPHSQVDIDFFESLKLGRTVTLMVETEVVKRVASSKTDSKDNETITGHVVLKIIGVYKPTPEEL